MQVLAQLLGSTSGKTLRRVLHDVGDRKIKKENKRINVEEEDDEAHDKASELMGCQLQMEDTHLPLDQVLLVM